MAPPFRVGVMQLTMEPVEEILSHARTMDEHGIDTLWLAEAYPWWRKHSMEARSSTALSPLIAAETERLAIGWGIISPFTRHPLQVAMEARVTQEVCGEGRFYLGFGASRIFMLHIGARRQGLTKPLTACKEAVGIVREVLGGEGIDFEGEVFDAHAPALRDDVVSPSWVPPLYVAGTGPKMQQLAGRIGDGLLTPSITTPAFIEYSLDNLRKGAAEAGRDPDDIDLGCTVVASIDHDSETGKQGAREIAGMYLANKVQNIKDSADVLLDKAGLTFEEIAPIADAMERGGREAAAEAVTDEVLEKTKPIAGTPDECVARIKEYREAGCTHVMLELWGDRRDEQIALFGDEVLPHVR